MSLSTSDPYIEISRVISRMEGHREVLERDLANTSRWRFRRRWALSGAINAYRVEIDALLELSASTQPFLRDVIRSSNRPVHQDE